MSKPFKLSVNFKKPVQQNFLGCNAIYHGFAGLPDCDGRVYTPEQCELEADRAAKMGLKIARTYFKWYAYDQATHTWNWDNETMTAFYRWCERMQKRGIDIALHTGWCNPGDVNSSSWGGFSPFHVEGDWPQSVENYAAWVSETVHQLVELRGFTNIKYLMFFTEPSRASGKLPAGKTAFECWEDCVRAAHNRLTADGRRHLIQMIGPNENVRACGYPALLSYAVEKTSDIIDGFSSHIYARFGVEDSSDLFGGNRVIFFSAPGHRCQQEVAFQGGKDYELSAYVKLKTPDLLTVSGYLLLGAFVSAGGNSYDTPFFNAGRQPTTRLHRQSVKMIDAVDLGEGWQKISHHFHVEQDCNALVGLFYDLKNENSMLFADDFCLVEKVENKNLLVNPGFETEEGWKMLYSTPVSFDLYNDWCSWSKWSLDLLPQGKGLWYDEYNVHFEYNKRKTDPKHGTRIAMANVAMMNSGVQNTLLWTLFDQQWPNNHTTNADSFVDGNHQCGLMPVLTESLVPYPDYYAFSLLAKYMGGEGTKVFAEDLSATRLHSTLSLLPDGNLSLLIVNTNDSEISFEYDFTKNMNITLYRHIYNPSVLERNEKAEPIPSDKTVAVPQNTFSDTIPAGGVAVYTTIGD